MTNDELDRLAAEKVMGFANRGSDPMCFYYEPGTPLEQMRGIASGKTICTIGQWQPSRNIAQAWELLDRVSSLFYLESILQAVSLTLKYRVVLWHPKGGSELAHCQAPSAAEAIVRACLKAKGVPINEGEKGCDQVPKEMPEGGPLPPQKAPRHGYR